MASQDFLLRARRPASLIGFNAVLPTNFKLIHKPGAEWLMLPGVNLRTIERLTLKRGVWSGKTEITPAVLSSATHYNLRVIGGEEVAHHAFVGFDSLFIEEGDPDWDDGAGTGDPRLDNSKLKRWFKNNGGERLDPAAEHPRSGRTDMRWWRWTDSIEWLDITIDVPVLRRRMWLGDTP